MKTNLSAWLLLITVGLWWSGCNGERIFYADFETDMLGQVPLEIPPKDPEGDQVACLNMGTTTEDGCEVIDGAIFNSVHAKEISALTKACTLRCITVVPPHSLPGYRLFWNGLVPASVIGGKVVLTPQTNEESPFFKLEFNDLGMYLSDGDGTHFLGAYTVNKVHGVNVKLEPGQAKYSLAVVEAESTEEISVSNRATFAGTKGLDLNALNVEVYPCEAEVDSSGEVGGNPIITLSLKQYVIDNVIINNE